MQGQQKSDHHSFLELLKPLQAALDAQKNSSRSLAVGRIPKALEGFAKSLEYGLPIDGFMRLLGACRYLWANIYPPSLIR